MCCFRTAPRTLRRSVPDNKRWWGGGRGLRGCVIGTSKRRPLKLSITAFVLGKIGEISHQTFRRVPEGIFGNISSRGETEDVASTTHMDLPPPPRPAFILHETITQPSQVPGNVAAHCRGAQCLLLRERRDTPFFIFQKGGRAQGATKTGRANKRITGDLYAVTSTYGEIRPGF